MNRLTSSPLVACLWLVLPIALSGCTKPVPPTPVLAAPYPHPRSVVVAPLMNQSPSSDFNTLVVTDLLVAELAQVQGLTVLPTERAAKVLLAAGTTHPRSVEEAMGLAQALGADGVVVGAVTAYEPYKPQKVGLTLQLYWVRADMNSAAIDPADLARRPRPGQEAYYHGPGPSSQVSGLWDASRNDVVERVRLYAEGHQGHDSPYGWRQYLVDSEQYLRFVCHEAAEGLMDQELRRITVPAGARPEPVGRREEAAPGGQP